MIPVKIPREIEAMRRACRITAEARALAGRLVQPGVTTAEKESKKEIKLSQEQHQEEQRPLASEEGVNVLRASASQ